MLVSAHRWCLFPHLITLKRIGSRVFRFASDTLYIAYLLFLPFRLKSNRKIYPVLLFSKHLKDYLSVYVYKCVEQSSSFCVYIQIRTNYAEIKTMTTSALDSNETSQSIYSPNFTHIIQGTTCK